MNTRVSIAAAATALALFGTSAQAEGWFGRQDPMPKSQIRQAAPNRYAPYANGDEIPSGHVYASGYYTSRARAAGPRSRYSN